jgi:hypothetical protein
VCARQWLKDRARPDIGTGQGGDVLEEGGVLPRLLVGQVATVEVEGDPRPFRVTRVGLDDRKGVKLCVGVGRQLKLRDAILFAHPPDFQPADDSGALVGEPGRGRPRRDPRRRPEVGVGTDPIGDPLDADLAPAVTR